MNKIIKYTILWFNTLIKPLFILLMFGEVGIGLYTKEFSDLFWIFLILGYIMTASLIYSFYKKVLFKDVLDDLYKDEMIEAESFIKNKNLWKEYLVQKKGR